MSKTHDVCCAAAKNLVESIKKVLDDPQTSCTTIGRIGALLFDYDNVNVAIIRGESEADLDRAEMPFLIAQGLDCLNDPRITSVVPSNDGDSAEVVVSLCNGTDIYVRSDNMDEERVDDLFDGV